MSCPTREGLLWRGRGEAAGDCTVTAEPSASLREQIVALSGKVRDLQRHRSQGTDPVRRGAFIKEKSGKSPSTKHVVAAVQGRARRKWPTAASWLRTLPEKNPRSRATAHPKGDCQEPDRVFSFDFHLVPKFLGAFCLACPSWVGAQR